MSEALAIQRVTIENFALEDGRGDINGAALGYIYGFVDAGLQVGGLDITTSNGARALFRVLAKFAPRRADAYQAFLDENIPGDVNVMNGVLMGGGECKMWLVSDHERIPGSWRQCFSSAESTRLRTPPRHGARHAGWHGVATAAANSSTSPPGEPAADVAVGSG